MSNTTLITREEFEKYVPSAVMPDDTLYERIAEYIDEGNTEVKSLLGSTLYEDRDDDDDLLYLCNRMACLWAYKTVIPHLDLVLTENGFGVVNNQNVSPASMQRVNTLRLQVQNSLEDTIDDLLDYLRGNASWVDTYTAKEVFRSMVWNAKKQMFYFGQPNSHRAQMDELRPKINDAEVKLKHCISEEFFDELCNAVKNRTATAAQDTCIHYIMMVIASDATDDYKLARFHVGKLVDYLDRNIRTFTTYANSTAYAANTFEPYQNEKEDPCYFFG